MSDTDYDDDQETPDPQPKRNWRRELEEKASEATRLKRENAILKAGLTLNDKQIGLLAGQLGDDTSPEAIKGLAAELGWGAPAQQTDSGPSADEVAAFDRAATASNGAGSPASKEDPVAAFQQALEEGGIEALMAKAGEFGVATTWEQQ